MSTEQNKAVARRWYEEGSNKQNVAVIDELFTAGFVTHNPVIPGGNREGFKQFVASADLLDLRTTVEDMIAEGDKVVARFVVQGTPQGDFMGIPATGKSFTMTAIDILRFEDGKIAEHWLESDQLGMLQQLGAILAPSPAAG